MTTEERVWLVLMVASAVFVVMASAHANPHRPVPVRKALTVLRSE